MLHKLGFSRTVQLSQGPALLAHSLASACIELDATIAASYGGEGQIWKNLVAAPADGSSAAAYHFFRGYTDAPNTDDPGFMGDAGQEDAYWLLDGDDGFRQNTGTDFLSHLHKSDGQDFTVIAAFRYQPNSNEQRIFTTQLTAGLGAGISVAVSSAKRLLLRQRGDETSAISTFFGVSFIESDYLCIISHNRQENMTRFWVNNRVGTSLAHSFGASTGEANLAAIGARATINADFMQAGTRFYHFGMLNTAIGDAEAGIIYDLLNARHNRVYG